MTTPNNGLPLVPENTIDPAAGLNLALMQIDALLQLAVASVGTNTPPASPASGARYIIGTAPTGAWAGRANQLARWLDGAWSYFSTARVAVNLADGGLYVRGSGGTWGLAGGGSGAAWGSITGTLSSQTDLVSALNLRERVLTAGSGITIDRTDPDAPVISATGGGGGMTNPMTGVGDLIRGDTSGAPTRLAPGANGHVLTLASGIPTWAALPAQAPSPVVTESTTARTAVLGDVGSYVRFTNASASTYTIPPQASVAWAANSVIEIRRAGAGNLTLVGGGSGAVTLNAPNGGTLVLADRMSVMLKRVAENVWDVIGQTVAA